jgi:hypothetical protein
MANELGQPWRHTISVLGGFLARGAVDPFSRLCQSCQLPSVEVLESMDVLSWFARAVASNDPVTVVHLLGCLDGLWDRELLEEILFVAILSARYLTLYRWFIGSGMVFIEQDGHGDYALTIKKKTYAAWQEFLRLEYADGKGDPGWAQGYCTAIINHVDAQSHWATASRAYWNQVQQWAAR